MNPYCLKFTRTVINVYGTWKIRSGEKTVMFLKTDSRFVFFSYSRTSTIALLSLYHIDFPNYQCTIMANSDTLFKSWLYIFNTSLCKSICDMRSLVLTTRLSSSWRHIPNMKKYKPILAQNDELNDRKPTTSCPFTQSYLWDLMS